ncbi:thermonuclease family protein [Micrococcus yunnanensis]|uniref:Endonuclease YncB(Thermonuclease family) n=1 Tax=Micrococcus yunnanensis TaxID=566027 RepID=A0ABR6D130_9MICC|nr:thermonuclease family protein [Micrococcus yunnanensis]MCV7458751.1 thermonuclease family protein [Micrococcus luteus]TFI12398.1 nuclease [Thiopseudomonas sp. 4R-3cl]MBA9059412.1 endonuclease YncB(thermonuclease family) [Micrococcus yunnanensis]MCV7522838.1 thermonuclease family protein [Micrococcus luteus]MCV7675556.1 thermonuclease family protein [Micrococcus luteus]
MPLARLRAALPAAALSLLLLTGCTATDDGVTPASDADTSASVSTMPTTPTPSVDGAATSRAAASSLAASSAAQSSRAAASSSSGAAESRAAEGSRSAEPAAPAAPADVEGDVVTVESISDGDTLRVTLGEVSTRVRLLNIDTPETHHPSKPVECMGPEATAALKSMISPGDTVVLRYDRRLYDRYDRLLAGVYAHDVLVNAEMARLGYGEPAVFDGNDRFLPEVEAAWEEARANGVGRFSGECGTAAEPIPEAAPAPAPEAAPAAGDAGPVSGADSVCPDSHPVKANDNSGIYHMPGQQHYGKTNARHCYASASAAQAGGYRAARR